MSPFYGDYTMKPVGKIVANNCTALNDWLFRGVRPMGGHLEAFDEILWVLFDERTKLVYDGALQE